MKIKKILSFAFLVFITSFTSLFAVFQSVNFQHQTVEPAAQVDSAFTNVKAGDISYDPIADTVSIDYTLTLGTADDSVGTPVYYIIDSAGVVLVDSADTTTVLGVDENSISYDPSTGSGNVLTGTVVSDPTALAYTPGTTYSNYELMAVTDQTGVGYDGDVSNKFDIVIPGSGYVLPTATATALGVDATTETIRIDISSWGNKSNGDPFDKTDISSWAIMDGTTTLTYDPESTVWISANQAAIDITGLAAETTYDAVTVSGTITDSDASELDLDVIDVPSFTTGVVTQAPAASTGVVTSVGNGSVAVTSTVSNWGYDSNGDAFKKSDVDTSSLKVYDADGNDYADVTGLSWNGSGDTFVFNINGLNDGTVYSGWKFSIEFLDTSTIPTTTVMSIDDIEDFTTDGSSSSNSGLSGGAIAGIVIGSIIVVALLGYLVYAFLIKGSGSAAA